MKFCINLTLCFRAVNSAFLILAFALTGCTMTAYKSNSVAISAKPANYPIPIYAPEMAVPRPCEIIGTVSINAGKLAMFGGSVETELKRLMQKAHEKGADAVRLTDVEKPDFANPSYSLKAELLRYSTAWETVAIPENEFQAHLAANRQNLDPIEGVWFSGGQNPHSIGIVKNSSKPGRDFIGFILD